MSDCLQRRHLYSLLRLTVWSLFSPQFTLLAHLLFLFSSSFRETENNHGNYRADKY